MEATSYRPKKMGARGISTEQDAGTMVAQTTTTPQGTNQSISRSMTRYKGNRRNANPLPAAPLPTGSTGQQDIERLPVISKAAHLGQIDPPEDLSSRSRLRAKSTAQSQQRSDPVKQSVLEERQERVISDEVNGIRPTIARDHTQDSRTSKPSRAPQDPAIRVEDRGAYSAPQAERDRRNTMYNPDRTEEKASRPTYGRSTKSQDAVAPSSRLIPVRQTFREQAGTVSQRTERQVPRPQVFDKSSSRAELKRMISGPIPIEPDVPPQSPPRDPKEPVAAPRFDAPISAVNAGSRMVRVKFEGTEVSVAIAPSTTPIDLIRSTARQISAPIDERSIVVLESFKQVGLERPLRKYEHIRDVLNSWDYDAQNTLVIVASPTGGRDDDLDVNNVSKSQPGETTVHLYHSQKPGHWDKRWITLRSDGQVVVSKKQGGETANICHLSDFDIYIPTPRSTSKKIKPPKKVCFAIKSQQKSSMFLSAANFVHFFSTSDRQLATTWYKAVQEWRSWYLVNMMGEGQKGEDTHIATGGHGLDKAAGNGSTSFQHQPQISPMKYPRTQGHKSSTSMLPKRNPTTRAEPPSQPRKLTKDLLTAVPMAHNASLSMIQKPAVESQIPNPFTPTSLLGRTYKQRQKAQHHAAQDNPPPPMPSPTIAQPPSTTASPIPVHQDTFSAAATAGVGSTSIKRTSSTRRPQPSIPKPLVDLTPQYQPPPQHMRKGRGVKPEQVPAGGLIEVATSPEAAIQIPPSREWRRPGTAGGGGGSVSPHRGGQVGR